MMLLKINILPFSVDMESIRSCRAVIYVLFSSDNLERNHVSRNLSSRLLRKFRPTLRHYARDLLGPDFCKDVFLNSKTFLSYINYVAYSISSVAETRDGALSYFSRKVEFTRWFPVAFLANGVLKVTRGGIELTTPVLRVRMLNYYVMAPL